MLIGVLIIPAVWLFIQSFIVYGIILTLSYLVIESSRTGVEFDFHQSKLTRFREFLFFMKIPLTRNGLNDFSYYRVRLQDDNTTVSANWVQYTTVAQEHCILDLLHKNKGEFIEIVKSEHSLLQSVFKALEEQNISALEE